MSTSSLRSTERSAISVSAGFLGAFIVSSLAVQLFRSYSPAVQNKLITVDPVIASPATLWSELGTRDNLIIKQSTTNSSTSINIEPVVASEATLWSPIFVD
ncbi:hypothetical protein [Prochlorococcus marinus]|uniref:hypothetical protein n=1 Tax=Prochlorococcus marinus TaxID=1219 RepID=UPI0039AFBB14